LSQVTTEVHEQDGKVEALLFLYMKIVDPSRRGRRRCGTGTGYDDDDEDWVRTR